MKAFKVRSIFVILLSILWIIFYMNIPKNNSENTNSHSATSTGCAINNESELSCGSDTTWTINKDKEVQLVLGTLSKKEELIGKPSFLRWAWKFCAYCRDKVPQVENLIQKEFGDKINLQMMTMNFESAKFSTSIPQTPYETFNYKDFTNETCDEFPTWVILDKDNKLIEKECWGKTTIEEVSKQIESLLK